MDEDGLITLEQAAARLGLLTLTLHSAVRRGYLFPTHVERDTIWFHVAAAERYGRALGRSLAASPTAPAPRHALPAAEAGGQR